MTNEDFLAKLNPKTRAKLITAAEISEEKLALPSIGITRALSGGVYYRSQTMLWGNKSGGKSSLAMGMVANAQAEGRECLWVDAEGSFRPTWPSQLGVDLSRLPVLSSNVITDITEAGMDFLTARGSVLVIDSITPLLPQSYFSDKGEIKDLDQTNQIGSLSRDLQKMLGMFLYANRETAIVLISQQRNQFGSMHATLIPSGGKGTEHLNTVSIKIFASNSDAEQVKGDIVVGDKIHTQNIGRKVSWLIDKDRGPGMMMSGEYRLMYKGAHLGIDSVGELLEVAVHTGLIEKSSKGGWHTIYGQKVQGDEAAARYLRENPMVMETLEREILDV